MKINKPLKMKVLFLTLGNEEYASSRTRVYQYLPHLSEEGIAATVLSSAPSWARGFDNFRVRFRGTWRKILDRIQFRIIKRILIHWSKWTALRAIRLAPEYDIIYIQKIVLLPSVYARLRQVAKCVVYDIDDAIFLEGFHKQEVEEQIRTCDLMIVASEFLASHAQSLNPKVALLPTPIDTDRYIPCKPQSVETHSVKKLGSSDSQVVTRPITIGWIGSQSTTKYLKVISSALQQLHSTYGERIQITLIGSDPQQVSVQPINIVPWSLDSEQKELSAFDIGIMPLPYDDEWAAGKAGYKLLQYMAIGIPCVASPVGVNQSIVMHGDNGFLADEPSEWVAHLSQLIDSAELRDKMGRKGRQMAEAIYSHRFLAKRLVELLESCSKS